MAKNRVIGANGAIPWHLPEELKRFKSLTLGHHIIMGRKTWESIGRLLPGRTTVIVTRRRGYSVPGAKIAHSLDEAIAACGDDGARNVIVALARHDHGGSSRQQPSDGLPSMASHDDMMSHGNRFEHSQFARQVPRNRIVGADHAVFRHRRDD